ncbi:unnamed protein product [Durusdinium trenchii]|uniref:Protein kinase domain-containing protein n=1 Tax=Durusdinium trenchii TaxID=1381693 RepID=A0ABP0HFL9_9DINO
MASNLRLWSERVVDHWSGQTQEMRVREGHNTFEQWLARFEIFVKVTRFILEGDALILTNSVPFGQAYWEPSTEAGYEPNMEMCLGSHGGVSSNGTWLCDGPVLPVNVTQQSVLRNSVGIGIGVELVLGAVRPQDVLSQASLDEVSGALQLEGDIGSRALAMEANRDYRLRIWLRASAAPTLWTIRTDDVRGFLSNTNDGLLPGVLAVPEMSITVTVMLSRTPPESSVWVRIHILTGPEQSQFSRLQLLLPYGFSPVGADADPTARLIVELSLEQGEGILDSVIGMTFNLRIQTPPQSIPDARWFVLAKQVIVDEITGEITEPVNGWAFANGFGVEPCPVTLMYGSIASATGWLALSFYVPRSVQGRFVLITAPLAFEVRCPQAEQTGLVLECQDFRPRTETPTLLQSLQRTVNVTLVGGTEEGDNMLYMYLLNVLTPAEEPIYDPWQLRILDAGFYVVDAALNVPQPGFVPDLEMGNPSLSWLDPPQMGEVSNVQVEVSFLRRVKGVKAILVSLPENYRHDIQHKNQLRNVNKLFPLTIDEEWRVFDNLRYIKVLVEVVEVSNQAQIITSGTYQWQFPVMVPLIEPFASEWYVSLCAEPTCSAVGDPGILASFPVLNNEPQLPAKTFQVKKTTKISEGLRQTELREVFALANVSMEAAGCPYIVRYFSSWLEDGRLHVQTELCHCSLRDRLNERMAWATPSFSENELLEVLRHVASGLQVLHSLGFVHLDIKPDNILVSRNEQGCYKIADLGLAAAAIGTGCDEITEGDCRYLAKEVLRGDLRDLTKADIFSLGLVLYELATNPQQLPSNGPEWQMLRERLEVQHLRQLSHPVQLLLQEMVKPQKEARPSCEALIQRVGSATPEMKALEEENRRCRAEALRQKQLADEYWQEMLQMKKQELLTGTPPRYQEKEVPKIQLRRSRTSHC